MVDCATKVRIKNRYVDGILTEVRKYPDVKIATEVFEDTMDKLKLTAEERADMIVDVYKAEPRLIPSGEVCRFEIGWQQLNSNGTLYIGKKFAAEAIKNKYSAFLSKDGVVGDKIKINYSGLLFSKTEIVEAIENQYSLFVIFRK